MSQRGQTQGSSPSSEEGVRTAGLVQVPGYPERALSLLYEGLLKQQDAATAEDFFRRNRDKLLAVIREQVEDEASHIGLQLLLRADPNFDFSASSHEGRVRLPPRWRSVRSLREATQEAQRFIAEHDLGAGNWTGGDVYRDGHPYARVSYNGKAWNAQTGDEIVGEILDEDLPPLEIVASYTLTQGGTIEGKGGLSYKVTVIKSGAYFGYVREGLRGDSFQLHANERLAHNRGTGISRKMQQVLYLASNEAGWSRLAIAVSLEESVAARKAGRAARPVTRHPRWTVQTALAAIDIALWDIEAKRLGMPIWRLAGAAEARPQRVYYSHWSHKLQPRTPQALEQLAPVAIDQKVLVDARHTRWASPYGLTALLTLAQSRGLRVVVGTASFSHPLVQRTGPEALELDEHVSTVAVRQRQAQAFFVGPQVIDRVPQRGGVGAVPLK